MDPHEWDYLQLDWKTRARARAWARDNDRLESEARGIAIFLCLATVAWLLVYG